MGKINWGRVFLGGLLAGAVINIFEFVTHGVVLSSELEAAMQALGRQMPAGAIAVFVVWGFLAGIAAIWLYAVARPRFGPGAKTAAWTGVGFWVIGFLLPNIGMAPMGLWPTRLLVIGTVVGLVEMVVATIVGAWPYKE